MSKFVERMGVAAMALMLAYGLFTVSTLSIKSVTAPQQERTATAAGSVPAMNHSNAEASGKSATAGTASGDTGSKATDQTEAAAKKPAPPETSSAALPDPESGKKVFAKCKSCHAVEPGKSGVGPSIHGVVNRPVAAVEGYKYSKGMEARSADTWTPQLLDTYLANPKAAIPGTKMSFGGLQKPQDRMDVIAYMAQLSDAPIAPADLGLGDSSTAKAPADASSQETPAEDAAAVPEEASGAVTYRDPPPPSAEEQSKEIAAVDALKTMIGKLDYERARHHPLHNKPHIDSASDAECLTCHQEVLDTPLRDTSPAGVAAQSSIAWYQTLATYDGPQMNFHQRHVSSPFARSVMNLKCNFCHQGNDLREESPTLTVAEADMTSNNGQVPFTNRKMVNPSQTCLRCHGAFPDAVNIMGLPGPWPEARSDLESPDTPNGCLTCHAEMFRTNRHNVTYLNAATIEELAQESSDVCFGCHGGRSWYIKSYPYPRHAWPGMDPVVPDWAKTRRTESDPRYVIKTPAQ